MERLTAGRAVLLLFILAAASMVLAGCGSDAGEDAAVSDVASPSSDVVNLAASTPASTSVPTSAPTSTSSATAAVANVAAAPTATATSAPTMPPAPTATMGLPAATPAPYWTKAILPGMAMKQYPPKNSRTDYELRNTQEWLNGEPTTIAALRESGKVVLVDFWTYT